MKRSLKHVQIKVLIPQAQTFADSWSITGVWIQKFPDIFFLSLRLLYSSLGFAELDWSCLSQNHWNPLLLCCVWGGLRESLQVSKSQICGNTPMPNSWSCVSKESYWYDMWFGGLGSMPRDEFKALCFMVERSRHYNWHIKGRNLS